MFQMRQQSILRESLDVDQNVVLDKVLNRARELGIYQLLRPAEALQKTLIELEMQVLNRNDVAAYMRSQSRRIGKRDFRWKEYDMSTYKAPIPIHVVSKAIEIKEKLPNARFTIHAFEFDRNAQIQRLDPFLEVSLPGAMGYFIEVWDEPTFKGNLEEVKLIQREVLEAATKTTTSKFPYTN